MVRMAQMLLLVLVLVLTLQQSDAAHHGNTAGQCQKESKAVMAVKLHFGQEIGKSDEEESSRRKCQGLMSQVP